MGPLHRGGHAAHSEASQALLSAGIAEAASRMTMRSFDALGQTSADHSLISPTNSISLPSTAVPSPRNMPHRPSTFAAIFNGSPGVRANLIAVSGPFSGAMRPRKAR
jgi:hypothetical protein